MRIIAQMLDTGSKTIRNGACSLWVFVKRAQGRRNLICKMTYSTDLLYVFTGSLTPDMNSGGGQQLLMIAVAVIIFTEGTFELYSLLLNYF